MIGHLKKEEVSEQELETENILAEEDGEFGICSNNGTCVVRAAHCDWITAT